jgi:hypothetical protein
MTTDFTNLNIDPHTNLSENPWIKFSGIFKDDSDFAEIAEEIRAERLSDDESEVDPSVYNSPV